MKYMNEAWVLAQGDGVTSDPWESKGWNRAISLNDIKTGGVSVTTHMAGYFSGVGPAPLKKWSHVVGTWDNRDGGLARVYINGVAGNAADSASWSLKNWMNSASVGCGQGTPGITV